MNNYKHCPFCDYEKKGRHLLHSGKNVLVIFSNPRLTPGHLLVIPKRHVERPAALTPEERMEILDTTIRFQERIVATIATGCDIRQHMKPFLKQSRLKVDHVHFHLLPRTFNDDLWAKSIRLQDEIFKDLPSQEFLELKDVLQQKS